MSCLCTFFFPTSLSVCSVDVVEMVCLRFLPVCTIIFIMVVLLSPKRGTWIVSFVKIIYVYCVYRSWICFPKTHSFQVVTVWVKEIKYLIRCESKVGMESVLDVRFVIDCLTSDSFDSVYIFELLIIAEENLHQWFLQILNKYFSKRQVIIA